MNDKPGPEKAPRNGGELAKTALPAIGAAVIAAWFITRSAKRKSAKK